MGSLLKYIFISLFDQAAPLPPPPAKRFAAKSGKMGKGGKVVLRSSGSRKKAAG